MEFSAVATISQMSGAFVLQLDLWGVERDDRNRFMVLALNRKRALLMSSFCLIFIYVLETWFAFLLISAGQIVFIQDAGMI